MSAFWFLFGCMADVLIPASIQLLYVTSVFYLYIYFFLKLGGHHSEEDFAVRGKEPKDEVQIYTWKDATLRELTDLVCDSLRYLILSFPHIYVCFVNNSSSFQVKEVAPEARRRNAKLSFAFVYPDKRGRFVLKQVSAALVLKI